MDSAARTMVRLSLPSDRLCWAVTLLLCFSLPPTAVGDETVRGHSRALQLLTSTGSSLDSVAGFVATTFCNGLFISNRSLASLLSNEACVLGCELLPQLVAAGALNYTVNEKQRSVTARAGQAVFNAIAPSNASTQRFACLVQTSAQVGPLVAPILINNGTPYNHSDWPEAFNGTPTAFPDVDYAQLAASIAPFIDGTGGQANATSNITGIRAVVVAYKGKIIAERYAERQGFFNSTPLDGWAMGKSVMAALAGMRIGDGAMNLTDLVNPPSWSRAEVAARNITVEDALLQLSGTDWNEAYVPGTDALAITVGLGLNDTEAYIAARPQAVPAGTRYDLSTANGQLMQGQIRRSFRGNDTAYWSYPYSRLFKPIGAQSFALSTDGVGTFSASSGVYATARDWARLGQLYLQDGVWNGTRILPPRWANYTQTPSNVSFYHVCGPSTVALGNCAWYGASFWIRPFSGLPANVYAAEGFEGQFIVVLPSQELVVVILGWAPDPTKSGSYDGMMVRNISKAVPVNTSLPSSPYPPR